MTTPLLSPSPTVHVVGVGKVSIASAIDSYSAQLGRVVGEEEAAKLLLLHDPATMAMHLTRGGWTEGEDGAFVAPPHIELLTERILSTLRRPRGKLLVSMPRRMGKSRLCSIWLPAWYLATSPSKKVILDSYSAEHAERKSLPVRNIVQKWGAMFGLKLRPDSRALGEWNLTHGGGMIAVGAGGAGMGAGANLRVIDDPIKEAKEAYSETQREGLWQWWEMSVETGLEPDARIVFDMTRWHEDDIIGRILSRRRVRFTPRPSERAAFDRSLQEGEWEYLKLPALAEDADDPLGRTRGDALWAARQPAHVIEEFRGSVAFAGLFQQRPSALEGELLKREWFRFFDPHSVLFKDDGVYIGGHKAQIIIQSWDCSFKKSTTADFVVGGIIARVGANFYILDIDRARRSFTQTIDAIKAVTARWPWAKVKLVEEAANGHAIIDTMRHTDPHVTPISTRGRSKVIRVTEPLPRLHATSDLARLGRVWLPQGASWTEAFLHECSTFPNGTHDDQVDMMSQALEYLQPGSWAALRPQPNQHQGTLEEMQRAQNKEDIERMVRKSLGKGRGKWSRFNRTQ